MATKIEPDKVFVNFLRNNLTDINASRSGEWIHPDFPKIKNLGDNQFPRAGVTILDENSSSMGLFDDTQYEDLLFQIDVVVKKNSTYSVTTTDEALGTLASNSNSARMTFTNVPNTITNIKHAGTAYGTTTKKDTDSDFTSPASLAAGTVEWSFSTGNLNFSAADITSHDGQAITSTSITFLAGKKACQYIGRDIVKSIRNSWRTDTTLKGLKYPKKISNTPVPFDEDLGIFRQRLEYTFNGFNAGEGI